MLSKVLYQPAKAPGQPLLSETREDRVRAEEVSAKNGGSTRRNRLEFLDFLRCIAAFSVLIQHACEKVFPSFVNFCTHYFQFGVFGVTLFFLCSGFVIPVSLEKSHSLKKFWINRIFRLYPLYLVSILSTLILIRTGVFGRSMPGLTDILANLTMLQKFLSRPSILHLYWTLCLEMLFYIMISGIFVLGYLKKTAGLAVFSLLITLLIGVAGTQLFHLFSSGWGTAFYFSTMFIGFLYYRYYKGQVTRPVFTGIVLSAMAVLLLVTYFNLYHKDQPAFLGTLSFLPVTLAIGAAYLLFTICFFRRGRQYPSFLLLLGVISYSLYLVQGTVFAIFPAIGHPVISVLIWLTAITVIATITYHLIEKPFMSIGKKLQ